MTSKEKLIESCRLDLKNIRAAISPSCNLNCIYCDGSQSRNSKKPGAMEDFRRKPLNGGVMGSGDFLRIFQALHEAGFKGITFTGGEPMLNRDWDFMVREVKKMGLERVEMTTNGSLVLDYLNWKAKFPDELTMLKISLDTHDEQRYAKITGGGSLDILAKGIKMLKRTNPKLAVRVNKVVLRNDLESLGFYVDFVKGLDLDGIVFLDLTLIDGYNLSEKDFFEKEFVYISEVISYLKGLYGDSLTLSESRYGLKCLLPNGLFVELKDSNGLTLRDGICASCKRYCQEGLLAARVGTDGCISPCIDLYAEFDFIDGSALSDKDLNRQARKLFSHLEGASPKKAFSEFMQKHDIKLAI